MNISISTKEFDLSLALTEYVNKRLAGISKFVQGREDDEVNISVELRKSTGHHQSGEIFKAEMTVVIDGKQYRAVSEKENMYTAIDDAKDELVSELQKDKRKRLHSLRRGGAKIKQMIKGIFHK